LLFKIALFTVGDVRGLTAGAKNWLFGSDYEINYAASISL